MQRTLISVAVVGGGAAVAEVLARVRAQRLSAEIEVFELPRRASLPERWRAAMQVARGEKVVMLDAQALPADPRWLFHLLAPFADGNVDAVVATSLGGDAKPWFLAPCVAISRSAWGWKPLDAMAVVEAPAAAVYLEAKRGLRASLWSVLKPPDLGPRTSDLR
jgi:hypothetical protein